ncbi:MAG: RNA methyltransferase [Verrucomicrobia bacterium]|nr:RNA methyltransferase [Verrucomicrobiota bacterium]
MEITSLHNPKIKDAIKLNDRRARNETGLFLIEGYRELRRAVDGGVAIRTLFICPPFFLGSNEEALIEEIKRQGASIFVCTKAVFEKLSYRDRPDGLVAVGVQMRLTLADIQKKKDPFYIIAESIEKPGNLGTILRSADAAGVDAVIVCDRCTDIYNPNVVRASVGTLFTIPVIEAEGTEALDYLEASQVKIVAATPSATEEFTQVDLTGGVAICVGTEQLGLTKLWMLSANTQVRIPMLGVADSLNVATATTLLLYEVVRQRRQLVWK